MTETRIPPAVERQVDRAANGPGDAILQRMAETVGAQARAAAVYGEPVERDGVTVIPVARVRWGFGGGSGSGQEREGRGGSEGNGGGGGVMASPAGYIEICNGAATFHPMPQQFPFWLIPILTLSGGFTVLLILRGVRRLVRG